MTVEDVIMKYAKQNGFDGLVGDGCGCSITHPMPCGGDVLSRVKSSPTFDVGFDKVVDDLSYDEIEIRLW